MPTSSSSSAGNPGGSSGSSGSRPPSSGSSSRSGSSGSGKSSSSTSIHWPPSASSGSSSKSSSSGSSGSSSKSHSSSSSSSSRSSSSSSDWDPPFKKGSIKAIYAEPATLDEPRKISIINVHLRVFSQRQTAVSGSWVLTVRYKDKYGTAQSEMSPPIPGTFPGCPAGSSESNPGDWKKVVVTPPSSWSDIVVLDRDTLMAMNEDEEGWSMDVDFKAEEEVLVQQGGPKFVTTETFRPDYGIKVPSTTVATATHQAPNENKYGGAYQIFVAVGNGDTDPVWTALDSSTSTQDRSKWYSKVAVLYGQFAERTEVSYSGGPMPPVANPGGSPPASIFGTPFEQRDYWLIQGVQLSAGLASPSVEPFSFTATPVPALPGGSGTDFSWRAAPAPWTTPQSDAQAGHAFNGSGQFVDNDSSRVFRRGWRPAVATSVLALWDIQDVAHNKVRFDRVSQAAWAQPETGADTCRTDAVAQPVTTSMGGPLQYSKDGYSWYVSDLSQPVAVPASNAAKSVSTSPLRVVGPGYFAAWRQPSEIESTIQAGFWWNVSPTQGTLQYTTKEVPDNNATRIWKDSLVFDIQGPVDRKEVK